MNANQLQEIFEIAYNAKVLDVLLKAIASIAGPLHPGSELADTIALARSISGCLRNDLDALAEVADDAEAVRAARERGATTP